MDENIYNIIDTFLKIGLGAIIGFLSSFYLTKLNFKLKQKDKSTDRCIRALDKISFSAEEYFQKFSSLLGSINGAFLEYTKKGESYPQETWDFIFSEDKEFQSSWQGKFKAVSRLKLHGLMNLSYILDSTYIIEKELREKVILKKNELDELEINKTLTKMIVIQNDFTLKLSKKYNSLSKR